MIKQVNIYKAQRVITITETILIEAESAEEALKEAEKAPDRYWRDPQTTSREVLTVKHLGTSKQLE